VDHCGARGLSTVSEALIISDRFTLLDKYIKCHTAPSPLVARHHPTRSQLQEHFQTTAMGVGETITVINKSGKVVSSVSRR
jgi:hypothetical protein